MIVSQSLRPHNSCSSSPRMTLFSSLKRSVFSFDLKTVYSVLTLHQYLEAVGDRFGEPDNPLCAERRGESRNSEAEDDCRCARVR